MNILAKIAKMRQMYWKINKHSPTILKLGRDRVNELLMYIDYKEEEIYKGAWVYGMMIEEHENPKGLEVV